MRQNGSEISFTPNIFPLGQLMSEPSSMSGQKTAAKRRTSSRASADGRAHSASQDGQTNGQSGREAARVNRSVAVESLNRWATSGTCGPLFEGLSPSVILQQSLESRLRMEMADSGLVGCELTWKEWDMPSGGPICALLASALPTSGSEFILLPTPRASMGSHMIAWSRAERGLNVCPLLCGTMMGYPKFWKDLAMPSFRRLQRNS